MISNRGTAPALGMALALVSLAGSTDQAPGGTCHPMRDMHLSVGSARSCTTQAFGSFVGVR